MTKRSDVSLDTREAIHFETLLRRARETIESCSGHKWTDTAEHDPGITLLQALCFAVSDLAYRHTHPILDLLTPVTGKGRIFPEKFGPQWALTCTPITPEDFRRAILDLHDGHGVGPMFRNALLVKSPLKGWRTPYHYHYNPSKRQFQYDEDPGNETFQLRGAYLLFIERARGMEGAGYWELGEFLERHRNLCEEVINTEWVDPEDVDISIEIELADDCLDIDRVLVDVFRLVDDWVSPKTQRASAAQLLAQGLPADEIYHGPTLLHGWITALPAVRDYRQEQIIDISGVASRLLTMPGIVRLRKLAVSGPDPWAVRIPAGKYARCWGAKPELKLVGPDSPVKFFKRGQKMMPRKMALPRLDAHPEAVPPLSAGRYRDLGAYQLAMDELPPCYGLRQALDDSLSTSEKLQRLHLHQFLLPFEHWLCAACQALEALPAKLAFDRPAPGVQDGARVDAWPFQEGTFAGVLHGAYRQRLEQAMDKVCQNEGRELALLEYLFSYFGARPAPHVWAQTSRKDFLDMQQRYLGKLCELNYERSNVRIDQLSSLLKRIAARLGLGAGSFASGAPAVDPAGLPVHLIEYGRLLARPFSASDIEKASLASAIENPETLELRFDRPLAYVMKGHLIFLKAGRHLDIKWALVTSVKGETIWLDLKQNHLLKKNAGYIVANPSKVRCGGTSAWLSDMDYILSFADDQSGLDGTRRRRIQINESASVLRVGDVIVVPGSKNLRFLLDRTTTGTKRVSDFEASVMSVDVATGTFVAEPIGDQQWPPRRGVRASRWYVKPGQRARQADRFSFRVGIVLDRSMLADADNVARPEEVISWVESIVAEEVPCHIEPHVHWLSHREFKQFGENYSGWQRSGASLGDGGYRLLRQLSLGRLPEQPDGIGAVHVATSRELKNSELVDPANRHWTSWDAVQEAEVLFVPKPRSGKAKPPDIPARAGRR